MGKIPKTIKSLSFLVDQLTDYWSVDLKLTCTEKVNGGLTCYVSC